MLWCHSVFTLRGDLVTPRSNRADEAAVPEARVAPDANAPDVEVPDDLVDDEYDSDAVSTVEDAPALDERALRMLAFERQWWKHAGAKEQAIRETFGLSATRYYQVLNSLLDTPAALAHDPVLVGRLRRLRASRMRRPS
jgi:Protein of unknown function (DUF3263)